MQADLVVIGGGLAGSCLAAAVARCGWRVVVLERRKGNHHKVCGEFLSHEAQASLLNLGLHADVAALLPSEITHARFVSRQGHTLPLQLPGTAWGVSRRALDTALLDGAARAGASIQSGSTALSVTVSREGTYGVVVRADDGGHAVIAARAVVGAAGRHTAPTLRPHLHTHHSGHLHIGIKCHYANLRLGPEVAVYLFNGGYVGISPIENGLANVCMLVTQAAFRQAGTSPEGMFAMLRATSSDFAADVSGGQLVHGSLVSVAPVDTNRTPAIWDQYARVGDAVAMIPPLCGDGMAMAIRSAELCAPLADTFLRGCVSLADWETAYRTAWGAGLNRPLRTGRMLQALLARSWMHDGLLSLGKRLPKVTEQFVRATRVQ